MLIRNLDLSENKVIITIPGYDHFIAFSDLKITQRLLTHCTFSFFWRISGKVENTPYEDFDFFRKYLGTEIIVYLYNRITDKEELFKGLLDNMVTVNRDGASKGYQVSGHSNTISLEDLTFSRQHLDKTLKEIFEDSLQGQASGLWEPGHITPAFTSRIAHSLHSNEHTWSYLTRLAANYGEWMYWDGTRLQVGNLKSTNLTLVNGIHLSRLYMRGTLQSTRTTLATFDAQRAVKAEGTQDRTTDTVKDSLLRTTIDAQQLQYNRQAADVPYHYYTGNAETKADIDRMTNLHTAGRSAALVHYEGDCRIPLNLGRLVVLQNKQVEHPVIVVSSEIVSTGPGHLGCSFEAIPVDCTYPPYSNPLLHGFAPSQQAIVKSNADPAGMGRVKVAYTWSTRDNESPWLRTASPHAGGKKGFYFIPEVGEEVRVNFEGGNADRAYVASTVYNGASTSGYASGDNSVKAIHTRSGTKIVFNDAEGSVLIEDGSKNTVVLDGNGNIKIHAPGHVDISGTTISLNATATVAVRAGADVSVDAGGNMAIASGAGMELSSGDIYTVMAKAILHFASEEIKEESKKTTRISNEDVIYEVKNGALAQNGQNGVDVNSNTKSKIS